MQWWNSPGQNTGVGSLSLLQGSSQPRNWTGVSCIAGGFFTSWTTGKPKNTRIGSLSLLQGIFLTQVLELGSPALQANSLPAELPGKHFLIFTVLQTKPPSQRSVQFSCSVVSNCLRPHEPQHARPPCSSPTPRVHPNTCPLSRWCHPTISSSVIPFSSCSQSFPASGSFQMSQLFTWGGQSTGVSASTSVLPVNTQDWFPLGWTGWISLQSNGLSRVFSNTTVQKHQFFRAQLSSQSNSHIHTWPLEKP